MLHYRHELHQPNSHTRTIFYSSHFRSNEKINWNLLADCRSARTIWPRQIRLFTPNSPRPSWTKKASFRLIVLSQSANLRSQKLALWRGRKPDHAKFVYQAGQIKRTSDKQGIRATKTTRFSSYCVFARVRLNGWQTKEKRRKHPRTRECGDQVVSGLF